MVEELMRDFAVGGAVLGNLSAVYFYAYAGLQVPVGMLVDRVGPRRLMTWAAVLAAFGSFVFAASGGVAIASLGRLMVGAGAAVSWIGTLVMVTRLFPPARFALLAGVAQAVGMAGAVFGQAPLGAAVAAVGWRPTMTALAAAGLLLAAGLWAVPFIGGRYGIERPLAAAVSSLIFIGWGVAAPLIGWVSDKMARRRRPLIAGGAILTLSTAAIIYLPGLPLAAAALLLFIAGAAGSSMILAYAVVKEHNDPEASGAAYGLVNTAVVGSGALFQPLIGWLLDLGWTGVTDAGARVYSMADYESALAVLPAAGLFGIAAAWSLREGILPAPRTSRREEC
jgi:MFS family permease